MTNENNEIKVIQEEKCFCKSKFFKSFASVALGTFVGGFCAISLFAALNKPPMMPFHHPMMSGFHHPHHHMMQTHHKHHKDCKCRKEMLKKHFEKKMDFEKKAKEQKED